MADNSKTWREARITLPEKKAVRYRPNDTQPNIYQVVNNGTGTIYASAGSSLVNDASFDCIIPGYGSKKVGKPLPFELYLYSTEETTVFIGSMEGVFDASYMSDTQEIAAVGASGMMGTVDIRNLLNKLPAGDNLIGKVNIANIGDMPAVMGEVEVTSMPEVTINSMPAVTGEVEVTSMPEVTINSMPAVTGEVETLLTALLTGSKVKNAFEIIPDDATDLSHETIAVYIGFDGDLKVDLISGETITMYNLASGAWHPIQAKRVYATGTAATYILGAY